MFKNYTKKQNTIIIVIIIGVLFLSSLPSLVGQVLSGADYFLGGNHLNAGDVSVYLSYMEQVKQGKILVSNLFTSEQQKDVFFTPLWLSLGLISRITTLNTVLVFHLARIFIGFIFLIFLFYYFLDLFFKKFWDKVISFLIISLSSGLGLFFRPQSVGVISDESYIVKYFPVDLFMSESNTFLSLSHSSLFILSQLLIVFCFYVFLKQSDKIINFLYVFLIGLVLGFMHPYESFVILSVLGVYFVINLIFRDLKLINNIRSYILKYFLLGLGFLPAFIYFYLVVRQEYALWGWFKQNITTSPELKNFLIGFGLLVVFAGYSLYLNIRRENKQVFFLLCWVVVLLCIVYLPVGFQRKLINSAHIGIAILASYSIIYLTRNILNFFGRKIVTYAVLVLFLFFLSLSNFSFITTNIYDYIKLRQYIYLSADYGEAIFWLKENSLPSEAVLGTPTLGMMIPALAARPVFLGSRHQTVDFKNKQEILTNWLFQPDSAENKKRVLVENNIKYVLFTDKYVSTKIENNIDFLEIEDKALNLYISPPDFLEEVFKNQAAILYKVK